MLLPASRGPVSAAVIDAARGGDATVPPHDGDDLHGADTQLALWVVYELSYRGFDDAADDAEWDLRLVAWRRGVETAIEAGLRRRTADDVAVAREASDDLVGQLRALVAHVDGPPLARFLQRSATRDQVLEFLTERSVYHLKESDPHAFVLPRVDGPAKVALAELLYDEYGGGRPERLHSLLYADALRSCGIDATYGAHVADASGPTLLSNNVMSLLGLQRRLHGASLGHLAAFETTSTDPCRRIAAGIERVGLPEAAAAYFHEHVEADAVHEQVVLTDICANAVDADPSLRDDVLFGAAVCLRVDADAGAALMDRWTSEAAVAAHDSADDLVRSA